MIFIFKLFYLDMAILYNILWISSNEQKKEEITRYIKKIQSSGSFKINLFYSIEESICKLKNFRFEEIIIIIDGNLYIQFIELFQKNLKEIYIIPKIIIFTRNKEDFMTKNKDYLKIINHPFYNSGGIKTNFDEIYKFILDPVCKKKNLNSFDDKDLVFEYIDCKEKLLLPMFYKTLLEVTPNDKIDLFNQSLCNKYLNKSPMLNELLNSLKSISNIPIEILSKYYARIYTDQKSYFYKDLNEDLRNNKKSNYLSFIKVLYEGVKSQSLPLSKDKYLYRGSLLANKEIENIKNYLNKKIEGLPGAIIFSKAFLSFSKEEEIAKDFLNENENKNKNLSKVFFILEKDDNIDYSISTHADIVELSFYEEKEVLFFPFSSFEIKDIKETTNENEKIYEIKLLYLGKYIKEFEKNKVNVEKEKEKIIPNSEFKKQLIQSGLINSENITEQNSAKKLITKYEKYKENIRINKNKSNNIKEIIKNIEQNERDIKIRQEKNINQPKINNETKKTNENTNNNMRSLINMFNKNENKDIKQKEEKNLNQPIINNENSENKKNNIKELIKNIEQNENKDIKRQEKNINQPTINNETKKTNENTNNNMRSLINMFNKNENKDINKRQEKNYSLMK